MKTKIIITSIIGVLICFGIGYYALVMMPLPTVEQQESTERTEKIEIQGQEKPEKTKEARAHLKAGEDSIEGQYCKINGEECFALETENYFYSIEPNSADSDWNGNLVRFDKLKYEQDPFKPKEILIDNMRVKLNFEPGDNMAASIFSVSPDRQTLFLEMSPNLGRGSCDLEGFYSYNLESEELRRLDFKGINTDNVYFSCDNAVSPDRLKYARAIYFSLEDRENGPAKALAVFSLENNDAKIIVRLAENETLNESPPEMSDTTKFSWLDNNTIEYNIYDQTYKLGEGKYLRPLIETRMAKLSN